MEISVYDTSTKINNLKSCCFWQNKQSGDGWYNKGIIDTLMV